MISNNLASKNGKIEIRRITQVRRVIVFFQNNQNVKKIESSPQKIELPYYHIHKLSNATDLDINWICDICKNHYQKKTIVRFRCENCDFDVCKNCIMKYKNLIANKKQLLNYHNHSLLNYTFRNVNWKCNICKRLFLGNTKIRYRCQHCDFDVCQDCIDDVYYDTIYHEHRLTNMTLHPSKWICDVCKKHYDYNSIVRYRCNECDFDVCLNCKL